MSSGQETPLADDSDRLYESWTRSREKLDYFMVGLTSALTAYLGQALQSNDAGLWPFILNISAVLCLLIAIVLGIQVINAHNDVIWKYLLVASHRKLISDYDARLKGQASPDAQYPDEDEMGPALLGTSRIVSGIMIGQAAEEADSLFDRYKKLSRLRDIALLAGFLVVIAASIFARIL